MLDNPDPCAKGTINKQIFFFCKVLLNYGRLNTMNNGDLL